MKLQILILQYKETDEIIKLLFSQEVRGRSVMKDMQKEAMTIDEWLEHIERFM